MFEPGQIISGRPDLHGALRWTRGFESGIPRFPEVLLIDADMRHSNVFCLSPVVRPEERVLKAARPEVSPLIDERTGQTVFSWQKLSWLNPPAGPRNLGISVRGNCGKGDCAQVACPIPHKCNGKMVPGGMACCSGYHCRSLLQGGHDAAMKRARILLKAAFEEGEWLVTKGAQLLLSRTYRPPARNRSIETFVIGSWQALGPCLSPANAEKFGERPMSRRVGGLRAGWIRKVGFPLRYTGIVVAETETAPWLPE